MDVVRITHYSQLLEIRPAWNALSGDHPILRWEWLANWWKFYSGRQTDHVQRLCVLVCTDADKVVGIAPWRLVRSPVKGRVLRFLGEDEVCSDYLTILHQRKYRDSIVTTLVDYLSSELTAWDAIELGHVLEGDPIVPRLWAEFAARGFGTVQPIHQANYWKLALPSSWDEYMAAISKSHRKQLRRLTRAHVDTGRVSYQFADTAEDLAECWPILVDLHQRRRNALGDPGCFASPRFARFHREVAEHLVATGHLRLLIVSYEGQPIEGEYNFSGGAATYAYQSGLDPDHIDKQPGRLAMMHTIRRAIEDGHHTYDFMRGDEEYKQHWRAAPVPAHKYRIANNRATAKVRDATWRAARELKAIVKSGLSWVGGEGQSLGAPAQ